MRRKRQTYVFSGADSGRARAQAKSGFLASLGMTVKKERMTKKNG
jgi:hypothetical protein